MESGQSVSHQSRQSREMKLRENELISNYKTIGCYASNTNNKIFSKAFLACWSDFIKSNFSQGLNSSCL